MARCAVLVALGLGCKSQPPPADLSSFDPGPVPAEYREGERLFNARCATCHGTLAVGTTRGPPLVHRIYEPAHHADITFQRAVEFGVQAHHWNFGPMQPVEGIEPPGIARITSFVRWLQQQAGIF